MEDRIGRIKKQVQPRIYSETSVKMYYVYPFQKDVWP